MPLSAFHPAVAGWFERRFGRPTAVQAQAWPAIRRAEHTLLVAPTGSGKTLAAFLAVIDGLVREGLQRGLADQARVLYISPLKALSNDIQKNLSEPLAGIRDELLMQGLADVEIRAWVRTGDTPQSERERMRRRPPQILVTTPESAYILMTSASGRRMLAGIGTVIVDEIHALAGNKRGAHLALTLERLEALTGHPPVRVGLSATQKPVETIARFLVGDRDAPCRIVDTGHRRDWDLALALPDSPLETVMSGEVWSELYDRIATLVAAHHTTLVFVNTRRLAERAARHLAERLGEEHVTSHHGSLSREHRLRAEQRLKAGELKVLVATASLELGIDIGDIDLVCQLGSPRTIAALLQRVGRAGHALRAVPKGRLFPLSRDDLAECVALLGAAEAGDLDRVRIPQAPLDVLAQQIVAEVAADEWAVEALYATLARAWPYRGLEREAFEAVLRMLADGYSTRRGRRGAWLHYDAVNGRLRGRRGARLVSMTNGGAIPDQFDYEVLLVPDGARVGTLNEDFAFESLPGDIFQLGNTSYRVQRVAQGIVFVEDAHGEPPNIPFWFGEAPGRSDELSIAVSALRERIDPVLAQGIAAATDWLMAEYGIERAAAEQLAVYYHAARAALSLLPTQRRIVLERFFDEMGDMHLVIHSPHGSRLNRAWGLALRKRFCRKFNFELQAAALEDSIVLSLGPTHSFALEEVARYLTSEGVRAVLVQALLDAPMFPARWRWNATIALAVQRFRNGRKVPAQFQRSDAEDLIAVVFPDQLACLENIAGAREIPDHPLVAQSIADCLDETMDIAGLEGLLTRLESDAVKVVVRDLVSPSPLAQEVLNARPYAFLDDAPAEERRTRAVATRRFLDPAEAGDLGRLDAAAIERVRREAWPSLATPDELHDALVVLGFLSESETSGRDEHGKAFDWRGHFDALAGQRRVARVAAPGGTILWAAAERLAELRALGVDVLSADVPALGAAVDAATALRELVRSRLEGLGPVTAERLAAPLGASPGAIEAALAALQAEGFAVQGHYTAAARLEWCERRLLARIHRYTLKRLRSEIEPVPLGQLMRFLFRWHGLDGDGGGLARLAAVLRQLEGYCAPAAAWETDLLAVRVAAFAPAQLDNLCSSGRFVWLRSGRMPVQRERRAPVRTTPLMFVERSALACWRPAAADADRHEPLGADAQRILEILRTQGAAFTADLLLATGRSADDLESALAELVARGWVTADSFAGLRALLVPSRRRARRSRWRAELPSLDQAGRWSVLTPPGATPDETPTRQEHIARVLLGRYGIVCRRLLERESLAPPWRELLRIYWRLEARGEIRGGRFVQGLTGEQFALPEAVAALRELRRDGSGQWQVLCAADPLNLVGTVLPGERIPAALGNRVVFLDGLAVAAQVGGELRAMPGVQPQVVARARRRLEAETMIAPAPRAAAS